MRFVNRNTLISLSCTSLACLPRATLSFPLRPRLISQAGVSEAASAGQGWSLNMFDGTMADIEPGIEQTEN